MTEKPTVVEALSRVMADVQAVGKDSRNMEQNYSFRGIDAVVNAVGPALRAHGVLVLPEVLEIGYRDVQTSRGKPSRECTVKVRYRFHGPAGDHLDTIVPGESMDFGDKGAAKAMSVAYRIALLQALCIPTDEPDADSQSYERERDDWEAAKPATDEQVAVFTDLARRIAEAASVKDIPVIGRDVVTAKAEGRITPAQFHALDVKAGERRAALKATETTEAA